MRVADCRPSRSRAQASFESALGGGRACSVLAILGADAGRRGALADRIVADRIVADRIVADRIVADRSLAHRALAHRALAHRTLPRAGDEPVLLGAREAVVAVLPGRGLDDGRELARSLIGHGGRASAPVGIGLASSDACDVDELRLETLVQVALEGARVAALGPDDRWVHSELYELVQRSVLRAERAVAPQRCPEPADCVPVPRPHALDEPGRPDPDAARRIDVLERRIAKLLARLEHAEHELARASSAAEADPGVASIYRDVQGLDRGASDLTLRRELMASLFAANVELQRELAG